jgi:predicted AAA+ superfamily ATPase
MPDIRAILPDFNPWWKKPFQAGFKDREVYGEIQKFLPLRQIIAFTGLRRVGKTTLLFKAAEDAMVGGLSPRNTIYFSFDEFPAIRLRDILHAAEELNEKEYAGARILLLLDEVQKLDDWENQAKALYDAFPEIKMMISGSESLFIKRKSRAILAGRIFEFRVNPLTFREHLRFRGEEVGPPGLYSKELRRLYDEFLKTQGFPELVGVKDPEIIRKYIKESIVEKVIYRDIPSLFRIKEISILESLLNIIMDDPGRMIDLVSLGNDLKISRQTLSLYLSYLEESFLIRKLYNFGGNRRKVERKLKKIYPAILSPALIFKEDDHSRSKVFECSVVNQLNAEFFWRDPYKNEVDVIKDGTSPLPIEIKYGKIDLGGVEAFMRKFKVGEAMIISRDKEYDHEANGRKIRVVPAFKHFLTADLDQKTGESS